MDLGLGSMLNPANLPDLRHTVVIETVMMAGVVILDIARRKVAPGLARGAACPVSARGGRRQRRAQAAGPTGTGRSSAIGLDNA
jgi:hypothetical protein